jgi:hypothetical protein
MLVFNYRIIFTFSIIVCACFVLPVNAAFNPPVVPPTGGNVSKPIYSVGSSQNLSGGLNVTSGGFVATETSGIAIQGTGGGTSVYGLQSSGSNQYAIYGTMQVGLKELLILMDY